MSDRINFQEYREKNKIPSDKMRSICKSLCVDIKREGTEFYMSGWSKKYTIKTETLLDHALIEYKETGNIKRTIAGDFMIIPANETSNTTGKDIILTDYIKPADIKGRLGDEDIRKPNPSILVTAKTANKLADAGSSIIKSGGDDYNKLTQIINAILSIPKKSDVNILNGHKALLEASENGFLLDTEQVAEMTGFSKSTISSKKSGWVRYGFTFEKLKENNTTLWRVSR